VRTSVFDDVSACQKREELEAGELGVVRIWCASHPWDETRGTMVS